MDLQAYVPGGRVSTGLLGWWQEQLVWAVAQEKYWNRRPGVTSIPLVGIGGGQERGETLMQTTAREALEEANAAIDVMDAGTTLWVDGAGNERRCDLSVELAGEPAPLMIWQRQLTLRRDDGSPYLRDYINPVYRARFLQSPHPGAEIPGLLFTSSAAFLQLRTRAIPLRELLNSGASYVGRPLPADNRLELQGSAHYLAQYWERLAP